MGREALSPSEMTGPLCEENNFVWPRSPRYMDSVFGFLSGVFEFRSLKGGFFQQN
jgi:hypothetical protein